MTLFLLSALGAAACLGIARWHRHRRLPWWLPESGCGYSDCPDVSDPELGTDGRLTGGVKRVERPGLLVAAHSVKEE